MKKYPFAKYKKHKSHNYKWLYVFVVLGFFAVKYSIESFNPKWASAHTDEVNPYVNNQVIDNKIINSVPEPAPKIQPAPKIALPANTAKEIDSIISAAKDKSAGIIETRNKLNQLLPKCSNAEQAAVKKQLSELSQKWLFSSTIFPDDTLCLSYKVASGDTFTDLANKYKIPYEFLMQINNIKNPMDLRAGDTIKIIKGPFHCKVYRSTFKMDLYLQDTYVKSFSVGLGKTGTETPTGLWKVKSGGKLISPDWTDPDTGKTYSAKNPNYPLGTRWIALDGIDSGTKGRTGFAIHGTKQPEEIGMATSRGCIRLKDEDVKLVYDLLWPGASQVDVFD